MKKLTVSVSTALLAAAGLAEPAPDVTVISGQTFTKRLLVKDQTGVLIENCTFTNITTRRALRIDGCSQVTVRDCVFRDNTYDGSGGECLLILNSTDVVVERVTVTNQRSWGHSSAMIMNGAKCRNITIRDCHIYDVSGNGICSGGTSTVREEPGRSVHDCPNLGLKILNNRIHDTGLSPDESGRSPKHGMYVKAMDALIEGNTVYNCFDGQGISVRNTGIVRRNTIYNCKTGPLNYWAQKPAGPSGQLIIENNVIYQTKNVSSGPKLHKDVRLLAVNPWRKESGLKFDDFTVRFNTVVMFGEVQTIATKPVLFVGGNFKNVKVYGNLLIDLRTVADTPKYISTWVQSTSTKRLAKNTSNYTAAHLNDFVDPGNFDFHLKENSAARGYANGETEYPPDDRDGVARAPNALDAGAYAYVEPGADPVRSTPVE
ncbi:MAG: right-handed parallel beta-helix repeat-containing protein [Kiritimatiellae bacterium]|nr:right-handed parallel beta-helix repeat-containing protein [Kiritimatiellia bacterium]